MRLTTKKIKTPLRIVKRWDEIGGFGVGRFVGVDAPGRCKTGKSIEPDPRTVVTSFQDRKDAMIVPGSGQQGNHGYCCFAERRSPGTAGDCFKPESTRDFDAWNIDRGMPQAMREKEL